jgi:uncharacterized oligopeptide transporter (OPT) family protein
MLNLTKTTWFTFFALSLLLGLANIYSTLLTGWGDGGSIVAVILCLLFLSKSQRNIINYNLGQTMASAGGSVGFCVALIASIYYHQAQQGIAWQPSLWRLSLLVMSLSMIGVAIAVPFRRYTVKWFFPSAVACATILRAATSESKEERQRTAKIMGFSGLISALLTLPTKAAFKPGGGVLFKKISAIPHFPVSLDPLLYGVGMVVGPRIGLSLLLGGTLNSWWLMPHLTGLPAEEYVRWIAVGFMTLPAFSSFFFSFVFKKKHHLPAGFHPKSEEERLTIYEKLSISAIFLAALFLSMWMMESLFHISWIYVPLGVAIAAPACFALGKAASETDMNPVRLLAIALLLAFSLFEQHSPLALLALGVGGAIYAAVAVDLLYDLRTGYLIRANQKHQIAVQFLGVIPVAFFSVFFLQMLATRFGFGEGNYFPAPGAVVWSTMAEAFSLGAKAIDPSVWMAAGLASLIGIALTFFENWKPTAAWTPSSFAIGISLLLPFEMCTAIFAGSALRFLALKWLKSEKGEEEVFQAGSAIFAASALAGILTVILIACGILYLPA